MTGCDVVLIEHRVDIDAPREVVFELLTDAKGLMEWMAVEAESEPIAGGQVRWRHENGAVMSGRYVEVMHPSKVSFTYGWESGGPPLPPESTLVTIELEAIGSDKTRLHLVHSRLPPEFAPAHGGGWTFFLGRLAERCVRGSVPVATCPEERP